jgi:hypothetical protein
MIAVTSVVAKVFEKVVDKRLRNWSERVGALSDLQGGFREQRSTLDQIFILNEILGKRYEQGLNLCLAFIDVRKAYDRVWRPGLWAKLKDSGVGGRTLGMLQAMFNTVSRSVLVHGEYTENFEVTAGVPQGSVLSPYLYAVYINGLHEALRNAGLGIRVYGRLVPLLLYADDVVLLARSPAELQRMLFVLDEYAAKWRFSFNQKKSKVVVVGRPAAKRQAALLRWMLSGKVLELVGEYKYLGVETGKRVRSGRWNTLLQRLYRQAKSALSLLMYRAGGSDGLSATLTQRMWVAEGRPLVEYGCEPWGG